MNAIGKKLLFIGLLFFSSYSQAAIITWESLTNPVLEDDIFTLDIIGANFIGNVDGGGVNFSFDASVLNVLSVNINSSVWDFGGLGINTGNIDNVTGTVNGIMVNTFANVTGDFTVASIEFQAIGGLLSNSDLVLSEFNLNPWASSGSLINPTFANSNITIVPVPATAWLFGSGLIGLFGFARRRKASLYKI